MISHQMLEKFFRYTMAGGVGTLVHYILLTMTVELMAMPVSFATTIGFAAGAVTNYQVNRRYTFGNDSHAPFAFGRFLLVAIVGLFLNLAVVVAMVRYMDAHYLFAQLAATAMVLVLGFIANATWTFRGWPGQRKG